MPPQSATTRPIMLVSLVVIALLIAPAASIADAIRLHGSAGSPGPEITLGQVAELEGDHARALADTVVGHFVGDGREATVTLAHVRQQLTEADVNWGLLTLRGYTTCRVHRTGPIDPPAVAGDDPAAASNVESDVELDTALTLRGQVIKVIEKLAGVPGDDLRIRFDPRDADRLNRNALVERFELEPGSSSAIGRLPITIRRYEGGRVVESFTLTVDVERRALALVATGSIGRGDTFTADRVEVREVYLREDRGQPLADASLVLGQQSAAVLREGTVIYPDHVQAPVLVKRGELITVRCIAGRLVVRTVARAGEDGVMDQTIRVRNEATRETYQAAVTGRREAVVMLDAGETQIGDAKGGER